MSLIFQVEYWLEAGAAGESKKGHPPLGRGEGDRYAENNACGLPEETAAFAHGHGKAGDYDGQDCNALRDGSGNAIDDVLEKGFPKAYLCPRQRPVRGASLRRILMCWRLGEVAWPYR